MFGFFKKKGGKNQYLNRVAAILHENIGPTLPAENAYNLAEECLNELRSHISSGMFHDGPDPKEDIGNGRSVERKVGAIRKNDIA